MPSTIDSISPESSEMRGYIPGKYRKNQPNPEMQLQSKIYLADLDQHMTQEYNKIRQNKPDEKQNQALSHYFDDIFGEQKNLLTSFSRKDLKRGRDLQEVGLNLEQTNSSTLLKISNSIKKPFENTGKYTINIPEDDDGDKFIDKKMLTRKNMIKSKSDGLRNLCVNPRTLKQMETKMIKARKITNYDSQDNDFQREILPIKDPKNPFNESNNQAFKFKKSKESKSFYRSKPHSKINQFSSKRSLYGTTTKLKHRLDKSSKNLSVRDWFDSDDEFEDDLPERKHLKTSENIQKSELKPKTEIKKFRKNKFSMDSNNQFEEELSERKHTKKVKMFPKDELNLKSEIKKSTTQSIPLKKVDFQILKSKPNRKSETTSAAQNFQSSFEKKLQCSLTIKFEGANSKAVTETKPVISRAQTSVDQLKDPNCPGCNTPLSSKKLPKSTFIALEKNFPDLSKIDSHNAWEFCRYHHKSHEILIPDGLKKGFRNDINFVELRRRLCDKNGSVRVGLEGIINGTVKSLFRMNVLKLYKKHGALKMQGPQLRMSMSQLVQCGYYGTQGSTVILHTLKRIFTGPRRQIKTINHKNIEGDRLIDDDEAFEKLQPILTHEKAKPQPLLEFIQDILVPEAAIRLIAEDMRAKKHGESSVLMISDSDSDSDPYSLGHMEQKKVDSGVNIEFKKREKKKFEFKDPIFLSFELKQAKKVMDLSNEFGNVVYWDSSKEDEYDMDEIDYGDGWFGCSSKSYQNELMDPQLKDSDLDSD
ncbi:hypothetical protein HK096_004514 [Nowakowskiella sp. JEL0078]|nr:hypothetical protein HK096_004514 [Nowakowskiella sp. JEL0078]